MKHFFLFLAFLLPSFSFASFVPPQIPAQFLSSDNRYHFQESFVNTAYSDLLNGNYFCPSNFDPSYDRLNLIVYTADRPYLNTATSSRPSTFFVHGYFGGGSPCNASTNLISYPSVSTSTIASSSSAYPGFDYVFVNFNFCKDAGCDYSASSTVIGYMKFRYNGSNWVDTLGAGSSGSWTFSTSTPINPSDFADFAQGIKDAIANNTYNPNCPTLSSILEIGSSSFWQDCVLPSIFNWLFVPSDSAIDYMVDQMSSNAQYGSSFAYMLIMPIASAVSVTACDLDDVPSCSVGSPLTLPLLDVHGSSTPFVFDPVSPLPGYFDDWLSAIVAVLILAGVSRVVLLKFL